MTRTMEEIARQSIEWLETASHAERRELMKAAGILDEDGHLAERYRPPGAPSLPRAVAGLRDRQSTRG